VSTLQHERELILGLEVARAVKLEMLAVALTVGSRYFGRALLETVFREDLVMLKEVEFFRELFAEELEEGRAEGEALAARRMLLRQLQETFGELPPEVVDEIEQADSATCEDLAVRLLRARSLEELGIGAAANGDGISAP
jgi:predicted transposase YdaD